MKPRRSSPSLGVLVFVGVISGFHPCRCPAVRTKPSSRHDLPARKDPEQKVAPAVERSPAGVAVQASVVRCVPSSGDTQIIDIREEPSVESTVPGGQPATVPSWPGSDARTVKGDGDWIRVRYDGRVGWVDGATVICRLAPAQAAQAIAGQVDEVLSALKARNMPEPLESCSPVKGLRLSPYVDIDAKQTVVLTTTDLPAALEDGRLRRCGSEDGSGEPISRSFAEYYETVHLRSRFRQRPSEAVPTNLAGSRRPGQTFRKVYPNAIVVEAHVPGTKPESEGMDWASLLLVFEQHDSRWYVSALVHDQWTI